MIIQKIAGRLKKDHSHICFILNKGRLGLRMKCNKRLFKFEIVKILSVLLLLPIVVISFAYKTDAAYLQQEKDKTYYFYIPSGGFSTCV